MCLSSTIFINQSIFFAFYRKTPSENRTPSLEEEEVETLYASRTSWKHPVLSQTSFEYLPNSSHSTVIRHPVICNKSLDDPKRFKTSKHIIYILNFTFVLDGGNISSSASSLPLNPPKNLNVLRDLSISCFELFRQQNVRSIQHHQVSTAYFVGIDSDRSPRSFDSDTTTPSTPRS